MDAGCVAFLQQNILAAIWGEKPWRNSRALRSGLYQCQLGRINDLAPPPDHWHA